VETIGAFEAKTHLSGLLDRVARGERLTITKRGKPVAMLVPFEPERSTTGEDLVARMKQLAKGQMLGDLDIKGMIEHGRRM
jgi:prevent-host-death family protein